MNLINLNLEKNKNTVVGTFTKNDLKKYLKDITSEANQKNLRKISRSLYLSSSHYRTLINYYTTLYNFDYVVEGYGVNPDDVSDKEKYRKAYIRSIDQIEKINIKKESIKIRFNAYLDGVFYGFARPSKNSFYVQQLDPNYCKISFINYETGQLGYSFNFNYFSNNEEAINAFPQFFIDKYEEIKSAKGTRSKTNWIKVDDPLAICIKPTPDIYPIPPLVGVFEGILDIADFKALNKGKEEIGNYQLLSHKIPMKEGKDASLNDFLITEDFVQMFHENIQESLPEQVAVVTSPMPLEAIKFERDSVDKNKVAESTSQYWNDAGVSELLFGGSTNSTALKYSTQADEASLSSLVEEIQSWINEYIKFSQRGTYKFCIRILKTTVFNVKEYFETRLKAGQFGVPVKNELIASLGMTPSQAYLNTFLENEVLKLNLDWLPLSSSHTATENSTENAGAPVKSDENLSDEGIKTREKGNTKKS